jgi:CheY-like chemotaxis protein
MPTIISDPTNSKPLHILLVEDDDGDAKAVKRAFSKAKIANTMIRAEDGIEALEILRGENGHEKPLVPFLLLVDLNMPRMGGLELIKELRGDPQLKKTIVFILTTSKREEDRNAAYEHHVTGYIVKETAGRDFLSLVDMIDRFWRIVELPQ